MQPARPATNTAELRFDFGRNWASFAEGLDEDRIGEAQKRLASLLGLSSLAGLTFLDVGCGSGIHSLAALRLGAERVRAIDLDPDSVATANAVLARWWEGENYDVECRTVFALESEMPEQFDIVYSWGVLHHTGDMVRAIRAACRAVRRGGKLAIALYGKTPYCGMWARIKRWYVRATPAQKKRAEDWYVRLFGYYLLLRGQRLSRHIANYRRKRGMDFHHDVRDWIGGYPYESIRPEELRAIVGPLGFDLERQVVRRRTGLFGSGNDEYVFHKTSPPVEISALNPAVAPDWTALSDDPNSAAAKAAVRDWLASARQFHLDVDLLGFVEARAARRRVLDIGVAAHSKRYLDQSGWRHGRIRCAAAYCLGVDILASLVEELKQRGYNVRCVDATSDVDLGERFEIVFAGDVIEHVDNPVALLRFAGRHLDADGRLYVATPNPFSRKFYRQFRREGVVVTNLDHVAWISPTMALELGRRAGLRLWAYHLVKRYGRLNRALHHLLWHFTSADYAFADYVYEFGRARRDG